MEYRKTISANPPGTDLGRFFRALILSRGQYATAAEIAKGWKDSPDSATHRDGRLAEPPIALAEVQAYAFGAFRAMSALSALLGDGHQAHAFLVEADHRNGAFMPLEHAQDPSGRKIPEARGSVRVIDRFRRDCFRE